jgi:hypothetical protein
MIQDPEPLLHPREIAGLRPTQITVGLREVERKRQEWRQRADREGSDYLGRHMLPVVIGPKDRAYLIDNHHLALALHLEGVKHVLVHIIADLSALARPAFITFMDNRNWLHPFDAKGIRQEYDDIPKHVADLADDPYRSLAGALRRAGGYAKVDTPYAEFLWADFLRRRIKPARVDDHFDKALSEALTFANGHDTAHLPGWAGTSD